MYSKIFIAVLISALFIGSFTAANETNITNQSTVPPPLSIPEVLLIIKMIDIIEGVDGNNFIEIVAEDGEKNLILLKKSYTERQEAYKEGVKIIKAKMQSKSVIFMGLIQTQEGEYYYNMSFMT